MNGPIRPEALRGLHGKEVMEPALIHLSNEEKELWKNCKLEPKGDERYNIFLRYRSQIDFVRMNSILEQGLLKTRSYAN